MRSYLSLRSYVKENAPNLFALVDPEVSCFDQITEVRLVINRLLEEKGIVHTVCGGDEVVRSIDHVESLLAAHNEEVRIESE
jgi:hypothetical protein